MLKRNLQVCLRHTGSNSTRLVRMASEAARPRRLKRRTPICVAHIETPSTTQKPRIDSKQSERLRNSTPAACMESTQSSQPLINWPSNKWDSGALDQPWTSDLEQCNGPGMVANAMKRPFRSSAAAKLKDVGAQDRTAGFDKLNISDATRRGLYENLEVFEPTEVQEIAIPKGLEGRDLLIRSQTGTGKTLAYLIPVIERLAIMEEPIDKTEALRVLIMVPTREVAAQTSAVVDKILEFHKALQSTCFVGGRNIIRNRRRSYGRMDILIQTPGRMIEMINTTPTLKQKLKHVKILVIDEADFCLELGLKYHVETLLKSLPSKAERQTYVVSATFPDNVSRLANRVLSKRFQTVNTVTSQETPIGIDQRYIVASPKDTLTLLAVLLERHVSQNPESRVIVFFPTARIAQFYRSIFSRMDFSVEIFELHQKKSAVFRKKTQSRYRRCPGSILFTSDISARGVDYPDIGLVVQVGSAASTDLYVHRLGRTARAGKLGKGILILRHDEGEFLYGIVNRGLPIMKLLLQNESEEKQMTLADWLKEIRNESIVAKVQTLLGRVEGSVKLTARANQAYLSWLGFYGHNKILAWCHDKDKLVEKGEEFARTLGLTSIPIFSDVVAQKLGVSQSTILFTKRRKHKYK